MSDCVAGLKGRAFPRLALAGFGLILLSGCSSDVTRFSQSESPFSNPFASNTTHAAPTAGVTTSPLAQSAPAVSGTHMASLSKPQAVGGSAAGWTASGGSPIVVANGETLDTISGRYGVPASALLAANGSSSASGRAARGRGVHELGLRRHARDRHQSRQTTGGHRSLPRHGFHQRCPHRGIQFLV